VTVVLPILRPLGCLQALSPGACTYGTATSVACNAFVGATMVALTVCLSALARLANPTNMHVVKIISRLDAV
jgi:hypothetical protein